MRLPQRELPISPGETLQIGCIRRLDRHPEMSDRGCSTSKWIENTRYSASPSAHGMHVAAIRIPICPRNGMIRADHLEPITIELIPCTLLNINHG